MPSLLAPLLLAFGSGIAALIYEVVWFQLLELVIGSSAVSIAAILATFMGGTCLGSVLFPRLVPAQTNPLRAYAVIEAGIAAFGLLALLLIPALGNAYLAWSSEGLRGFLLRGSLAATCLLPPTSLMGATLPALSRQAGGAPGKLGLLYGWNIAGAVCGCLLSGFYLLRVSDVSTATYVAAAVNAAVAGMAWLAPLRPGFQAEPYTQPRASANKWTYSAIALSGLCALAAEAVWTRLLGLLLGASVYTLSIVLAVFLTGLGIGSGIGSSLAKSLARPREALGWCQMLAAGAIAWTAYSLTASLPYWPVNPQISTDIRFNFQLDLARAFWALLPPALLWGASFPLALAALSPGTRDAARRMAGVYAANTLGAIAGALGASLLLVGWIGSQRTQQVLIALAVAAALPLLPRPRIALPAAVLLGAVFAGAVPSLPPLLVAHGRYAATWAGKSEIPYAKEGIQSSVAVSSFPDGILTFHVAGKIQASNVPRDMRLQRMLGHLTTLTAASPRSVLVIGCGAGITAGAVAIDPRVERVTIAEIEPLVPEAASAFFSVPNFNVVHNRKVQIRIDDGRHYLLTAKERFDGITVDPLDPWVKGAANLYTREFYEAARARLNPGGVITMYIQLFETTQEAVKSAVATFFEAFPNGVVFGNTYQGQGHDMVLLGTLEPLRIDLDEMEQRFRPVADSLSEVGLHSPVDLYSTYAGRALDLTAWLEGSATNRDRNLRMQYLAGFGLNLDDSAAIYADMLRYRRFPEDLFVGAGERVDELRAVVRQGR